MRMNLILILVLTILTILILTLACQLQPTHEAYQGQPQAREGQEKVCKWVRIMWRQPNQAIEQCEWRPRRS